VRSVFCSSKRLSTQRFLFTYYDVVDNQFRLKAFWERCCDAGLGGVISNDNVDNGMTSVSYVK